MSAATFGFGFSTKLLILEDHCGTHVDSTYHFYDGEFRTPRGRTIDEFPLEKFMGEGVLIDVSFKVPTEPVDSPGHLLLLHPAREVLIVENLVHLDQIRAKRFEFYALPLHVKGATGSPVRAVAVERT